MPPDETLRQNVTGTFMEMPKYQCHKIVHALKIEKIEKIDDVVYITPSDEGFAKFSTNPEFIHKHQPQEGGYYVVYEDGYVSYSPTKAFEEGYTRI